MKIEILYLMDCPWCVKTKRLLREVLKELNLKAEVKEILIDSKEKAKKYGFIGSPTVRINGEDVQKKVKKARCLPCEELTKLTKKTTPFVKEECWRSGCRTYNYKGKPYPFPPKGMMEGAIRKCYEKN